LGRTFTGWIAPACGWRTYSITSSAMVRLFGEQAFKNLARPWANNAAVIVEGAKARSGYLDSGID